VEASVSGVVALLVLLVVLSLPGGTGRLPFGDATLLHSAGDRRGLFGRRAR
jgi:hypothetical protein